MAIVGARCCSEYGRAFAGEIAEALAAEGVIILSGMARGVDSAGHAGALRAGGETYAVRWQGAVEVGKRMANAIVEYVGGIQVVKAFSQSAGSYKKYSGAVKENAKYYVDWMRDNQKYMSVMQTFTPSVLIFILPVGLLLWSHGSLTAADFFAIVVLSLGFTGPLIAAMSFVDEIAVVGTNVGEINGILACDELQRPDKEVEWKEEGISLKNVSFRYGAEDEEVLKGIDLEIKPGTVTALVGPSGSGTIADADKIVVVEDEKIAAQGTGKELLANCPLYAKMWEAYLGVRDVA